MASSYFCAISLPCGCRAGTSSHMAGKYIEAALLRDVRIAIGWARLSAHPIVIRQLDDSHISIELSDIDYIEKRVERFVRTICRADENSIIEIWSARFRREYRRKCSNRNPVGKNAEAERSF